MLRKLLVGAILSLVFVAPAAAEEVSAQIINGREISNKSIAVAKIIYKKGSSKSLCTGTVITPKHILSAAHCVVGPAKRYTVYIRGNKYHVKAVKKHPRFRNLKAHDVSIFTLKRKTSATPIPILKSIPLFVDEVINLYGYGRDEYFRSGRLRWAVNRITGISNDLVQTYLSSYQVGVTCNGDSGGPAIAIFQNGPGGIIGVTSFGTVGCTMYSYFTNLQNKSNISFIKKYAKRARFV